MFLQKISCFVSLDWYESCWHFIFCAKKRWPSFTNTFDLSFFAFWAISCLGASCFHPISMGSSRMPLRKGRAQADPATVATVLSRLKAAAVTRLLCHQGSWSPGNSISSSKCLISFIIFHGQSSSPYYLPTFLDHLWISETAWIKVQIGTPLVKLFCCGHWLFGDALCFLALKMFHARECHLFLHSCLVSLGPVLSLTWWKDFGCLIRLYL